MRADSICRTFQLKIPKMRIAALAAIWKARNEIEVSAMGIFAAAVNEFANGSIVHRPWAVILDSHSLAAVLEMALVNVGYVWMPAIKIGVEQKPILRAYAYFILAALDAFSAEDVHKLIMHSITRGEGGEMPEDVQELLLMPIMDVLLSEIQDVCSSDCRRMSSLDRNILADGENEIENDWLRLEGSGLEEPAQRSIIRLESFKEPCVVGFPVDEKVHCPLFLREPTIKNTGELLAIIKSVAAFRKGQAAEKREIERAKRRSAKRPRQGPVRQNMALRWLGAILESQFCLTRSRARPSRLSLSCRRPMWTFRCCATGSGRNGRRNRHAFGAASAAIRFMSPILAEGVTSHITGTAAHSARGVRSCLRISTRSVRAGSRADRKASSTNVCC
jgi:hypothetical protein